MAELDHLEDLYLKTRSDTDLWQSSQLANDAGTVKLEATIPSKEPTPDTGGMRSEEELAAMGLSYDQIGKPRKEKTVELPEVQAIRQQFKEHVAKIGTGEMALEEVGKAGRKVAEAIAPGVEVAGRAMGLDEEGAAALSKGLVEFIGGLPGQNESDLSAGVETALAALPMVGMAIKSGKVVAKAAKGAQGYLGETINFGGIPTSRGEVYRQMQAEGHSREAIDAYMMAQKPITWTVPDEFKQAVEMLKSERGSVSLGKGKEKLPGGGVETPITWDEAIQIDEHQRAFDDLLKTHSEKLSTQRRGVQSDVQTLTDSISPESLQMESFLDLAPGSITKASDTVAAKRMFKELAEPVKQLAAWVSANPGDQKAFLALLAQLPKVEEGLTKIAGLYAESGRTQRVLSKVRPTGATDAASEERVRISDPYIQQWLEFFKEQDALAKTGAPALTKEKLIETLANMKTTEEFIQAAKILAQPTKWDMFIEYWINGLLSGPATHATNILSNIATIAWAIPERGLAALYTRDVRPSEPLAMLGGILEAQGDAWRLAWQAFKQEESQIGAGKLEGPARAITADALELTGVPGRAVDFLGSMIRLPGRTLLAADDYFKSIAMRAELRALAKREAFKSVTESGLGGASARARMREIEQRILTSPPESIEDAAKEFASYVTFTRDLGEVGQRVQALASTPVGRVVLPFVRTPTNIFKYAGERTPLAFASQAVREEISAGGSRRALALAKISLGAMTMSYVGMLAAEGIVTGGGPKDKQLRQALMLTGWQPYSFKIGDTYYSYARIEPLGSLFGLAADAADLLGQLPEKDAEQLGAALVVAISRNVANKTFIKGVAGTLNAVSSQDMNVVKSFLEKELPTILPYSTAEGQVARNLDPVMREVHSVLDAFKAKIPGLSDSLPPRRNLWGDPIYLQGGLGPDLISPIYTSTMKLDPVASELVRLELPLSMPSHQVQGVPLDPWEYDAYVVLAGSKPIINDMTLKARLTELIDSDLYARSSDGRDGGKAVLIRQWLGTYRDMAQHILSDQELSNQYLGKDFPELLDHLQTKRAKDSEKFNVPSLTH